MSKSKFVLIQKSAYFTSVSLLYIYKSQVLREKNTFSVKHNQKSQEIINIFG